MPSPLLNILILLNLLFIPNYFAQFSSSFREFLKDYGGNDLENLLTREDLGVKGSYGGGNHKAGEKTIRQPVILVHGIAESAGSTEPVGNFFKDNGYDGAEIFATTYGDAGKTNLIFVEMECEFVKMIRQMILTVSNYTSNMVNINSISLGVIISRKAILGGKCVDTGEDLGPPLTHLVHTFVGVAGPNWGSFLCILPIGACNLLNGINCLSKYLNDINSKERYEGSFIFTLFSTGDDIVGYEVCGRVSSIIEGADDNFEFQNMTHSELILKTIKLQYDLITFQHADDDDTSWVE
uniref:Triacylglycerol lipase n=1 Tax=Meloidogyne incognita TaxID=6306 RepID=A0A914M304_MELIC